MGEGRKKEKERERKELTWEHFDTNYRKSRTSIVSTIFV